MFQSKGGFGLGMASTPLRAPAQHLGQPALLGQSSILGQPVSAPPQIATRAAATGGGEPDINRALSSLSAEEANDYKSWNSAQKTLFLMGYQWLAVAAAKNLTRLDDGPYTGFFQQGIAMALGAMNAAGKVAAAMPDVAQEAYSDGTVILKEATDRTLPRIDAAVRRYRTLRDRVAWELASSGDTVEYEIVGDDLANSGVIFTRRIGGEGPVDVDAVFSKMNPKEAMKEGDAIEEMYAGLGVPFKRLDLSGANLGDVGAMPILATIITLVVGVLTFYYLYGRNAEKAKLNSAIIDALMKDTTMTAQQKADMIQSVRDSDSFFGAVLGSTFSWTYVIVGGTLLGLAFFVLPKLLSSDGKKGGRE